MAKVQKGIAKMERVGEFGVCVCVCVCISVFCVFVFVCEYE